MLVALPRLRIGFLYDRREKVISFIHESYLPIDTIYKHYFLMQSERTRMASSSDSNSKWVPKACTCFQRKGQGMILIAGSEILRFDNTMQLVEQIEKLTYYEALQEVLLLIGAINQQSLAKALGTDTSGGDSQ
jgi:hypothetical protein